MDNGALGDDSSVVVDAAGAERGETITPVYEI
jgi:hypothetical protein